MSAERANPTMISHPFPGRMCRKGGRHMPPCDWPTPWWRRAAQFLVRLSVRRSEPRCPECGKREDQHPVADSVSVHAWPQPIVPSSAPPGEIPEAMR